MYIQQLYTNCLAQGAYYVESNGEALVIDPMREPEVYIDLAATRGARIKFIFETHFHADFVSGHLDLARRTGARIIFGPEAAPGYPAYIASDMESFHLGDCLVEVRHTPGHTIESICVVLYDEGRKPVAVFTGDTLFVGDVGRPDLLSGNLSKEVLAGRLYDSLHQKLMNLPDEVEVFPGHGPGSACGRNLGKETRSTMGIQKKLNYALQPMSKEEFVKAVTENQPVAPAYFFKDAAINKHGYTDLSKVMQRELNDLSGEELRAYLEHNTLVLDTRPAVEFSKKFIRGSIQVGLDGSFAIWAGSVIPLEQPLILVCGLSQEREPITRLARIGIEQVVGYWDNDLGQLQEEGIALDSIPNLEASQLGDLLKGEQVLLLDVRNPDEYAANHVLDAENLPLIALQRELAGLDRTQKYAVYCAGGYRSMIACSLMKREGFEQVINISGGIAAIRGAAPELVLEGTITA